MFASAVTPYKLQTDDNPDGPLSASAAAEMATSLAGDEDAFYDDFVTQFFSAKGVLEVSEGQHVIDGAPHGCDVSHVEEWNAALIGFLAG